MIPTSERLIVSIYDLTGNWPHYYIKSGYPVLLWDKEHEGDILEHLSWLLMTIEETGLKVYGWLFAPPCTAHAGSGAWTWPAKDAIGSSERIEFDSFTEEHFAYIAICQHLIEVQSPLGFWCLESPVGRIETLVPELKPLRRMLFNPCDYGDPYTKKTILYGSFNADLPKTPVEPIKSCAQGSWLQRLGGKGKKTKQLRSATPLGFAKAFFQANQ